MKNTVSLLLKLAAALLLVGAIVFMVIKYIDAIVNLYFTVKKKLFGGKCVCDEEDDDLELNDICIDPDCACAHEE